MGPGAWVTVKNLETNGATAVVTDQAGSYVVPFLDPGTYSATAEKAGFKTALEPSLKLDVAAKVRVGLALQVGQTTQRVPETAKFPYLTVWYAAGLLIIGVPILFRRARFTLREVGWGSALAALSMGGQLAMAVALNLNVPGHIVFPIAIGGSVFIVILSGRLLFGERLNKLTAGGVSLGLAAVILLILS